MRSAELTLTGQAARAHLPSSQGELEAWVRKHEGVKDWLRQNGEQANWLIGQNWPGPEAAAYTCISLGGLMAIGDALRRRSPTLSASTHTLCELLWRRAALQPTHLPGHLPAHPPPIYPRTYRHLTGTFGLCTVDPAWSALLAAQESSQPISFTTSAVAVASDDPACFPDGVRPSEAPSNLLAWRATRCSARHALPISTPCPSVTLPLDLPAFPICTWRRAATACGSRLAPASSVRDCLSNH